MLKSKERWIIHYHTHLEPIPADGPTEIPLRSVLDHIEAKFQAGYAFAEVDKVTLRIQQMRIGRRWAALLVTNFDPRGANAAYGYAETGSVRPLTRRRGESNAYSAHVLIRLDPDSPTAGGFPRYRFAIEDVPGLGKTRVQPFLNQLIRDNMRSFRDRQQANREYYPRISFWPYLAQSLGSEVEEGVLKHFELVKEVSAPGGFDEHGFTTQVSEVVKLKPVPTQTFTFDGIFKAVKAAASRQGYDRVKIVYNGVDGNQRSAKFNPSRQDLDDVIQSKYEKVELNTSLTQCEVDFCLELIRKMRRQMTG